MLEKPLAIIIIIGIHTMLAGLCLYMAIFLYPVVYSSTQPIEILKATAIIKLVLNIIALFCLMCRGILGLWISIGYFCVNCLYLIIGWTIYIFLFGFIALFSSYNFGMDIFKLIVSVAIILYLIKNKKIKKYYNQRTRVMDK